MATLKEGPHSCWRLFSVHLYSDFLLISTSHFHLLWFNITCNKLLPHISIPTIDVSFVEREHHMHSLYLLQRTCVLSTGGVLSRLESVLYERDHCINMAELPRFDWAKSICPIQAAVLKITGDTIVSSSKDCFINVAMLHTLIPHMLIRSQLKPRVTIVAFRRKKAQTGPSLPFHGVLVL